jgi:hypothetical protein
MASSDAAQPSSLKVGFAGLGIMGTGMARNLLKSGLFASLSVWNRSIAKVGWAMLLASMNDVGEFVGLESFTNIHGYADAYRPSSAQIRRPVLTSADTVFIEGVASRLSKQIVLCLRCDYAGLPARFPLQYTGSCSHSSQTCRVKLVHSSVPLLDYASLYCASCTCTAAHSHLAAMRHGPVLM